MLIVLAGIWCVLAWPIYRHDTWIESLAPVPPQSRPAFYFAADGRLRRASPSGPPYGLWQFVYWLPGFNLIRGSSRFMLVGLLGIAVLAGIGFDRITRGLARRRASRSPRVFGVLLVAEYAAMPMGFQPNNLRYRRSIAGSTASRSRSWSPKCRCTTSSRLRRLRTTGNRVHDPLHGPLAENRPRLQRMANPASHAAVLRRWIRFPTRRASPASPRSA